MPPFCLRMTFPDITHAPKRFTHDTQNLIDAHPHAHARPY